VQLPHSEEGASLSQYVGRLLKFVVISVRGFKNYDFFGKKKRNTSAILYFGDW
jgi:hypothetical protein